MSTTETAIIPTYRSSVGPAHSAAGTARQAGPERRSILPKGACPSPTATLPAVTLPAAAGSDWRGRAVTEELAAVPAVTAWRSALPRPSRRTRARRHLRAALVGTLLAIVAITGLSAYAAQGIANARSTALCQAHIACK